MTLPGTKKYSSLPDGLCKKGNVKKVIKGY